MLSKSPNHLQKQSDMKSVHRSKSLVRLTLLALCSVLILGLFSRKVLGQTVSGIKVPEGFEVTKAARDDLATNVYCMTVSPTGEVFVAGPGYIKALIDSDGDKVFDQARLFANGPKSGAQGMCFDGDDLLCTGDGALLRFADANGDGVADGAPAKILPIKTGGEHDAHAIRKGPDGWWYLLAGNSTPILPQYYSDPYSPVKDNARAGFLMRIGPRWREKQIFCHGFRNAYDFDFNSLGEVFVYDSDGERDISLPWYRPTRLFRMAPADDAGFVSRSWKRPDYFCDMPKVIGSLGRGSPTGVVVGRSKQFPNDYHDAIFVGDWTFGRVVVFRRGVEEEYDQGTGFAIADGQFGFAVTDLDFAKDGSLLISVGGRGTEGALYRVSYVGKPNDEFRKVIKLPLSETQQFIKDSKSKQLPLNRLALALLSDSDRKREAALEAVLLSPGIWRNATDDERSALEDAVKRGGLRTQLKHPEIAARNLSNIKGADFYPLGMASAELSAPLVVRALLGGLQKFQNGQSTLDNVRRLQLVLGGCSEKATKPMFVGYTPRLRSVGSSIPNKLAREAFHIKCSSLLVDAFRMSDSREISQELGRLAAMCGHGTPLLQAELAKQLTNESAVPDDIHWLICLARVTSRGNQLDAALEDVVAKALLGIGSKLERDELNIDRNFYPRLRELANLLFVNSSPEFATKVAEQITGESSQIFLLDSLPSDAHEAERIAIENFAKRIESDPENVTAAVLRVIIGYEKSKFLPLVRQFSGRPELRPIVAQALTRDPIESDRTFFFDCLKSSDLTTVKNGAIGLRRLYSESKTQELMAAYSAMTRLSWDKPSNSVRDQLLMLMEKHAGQSAGSFGYESKKKGRQIQAVAKWTEWLKQKFPDEMKAEIESDSQLELMARLAKIDWGSADVVNGKSVYKQLQCAQCHDGGSRLGPKLEGVTRRFNRDDLFKSIVYPHEQVPERYRALLIETTDGKLYRGSMVYESVDGITLQEVGGSTVRINKSDIESKMRSAKSLMPDRLLAQSSDQDWVDLYAYLKSL